jgi:hypothetical protein
MKSNTATRAVRNARSRRFMGNPVYWFKGARGGGALGINQPRRSWGADVAQARGGARDEFPERKTRAGAPSNTSIGSDIARGPIG